MAKPADDRPMLSDVIAEHPHLQAIAQQHARMVEVAIYRRNKDQAIAAVERAFFELRDEVRYEPKTRLDAVLPLRIAEKLEMAGIRTLGQLCNQTPGKLLEIKQISAATIQKLEAVLENLGLHLASD
jgi:DNA-directed RNA polymerase alpha subunit